MIFHVLISLATTMVGLESLEMEGDIMPAVSSYLNPCLNQA